MDIMEYCKDDMCAHLLLSLRVLSHYGCAQTTQTLTHETVAFTPGAAIAGGLILGVSSLAHYLNCGKAVGASGLFRAFTHKKIPFEERLNHLPFLAGLFTSAKWIPLLGFSQQLIPVGGFGLVASSTRRAAAGLLVGVGSVAGNGCTSGHGLSGIGRLSVRSLINTCVFMASGAITALMFDTTGALGVSQRARTLDSVRWLTSEEFSLFGTVLVTGAIISGTIALAGRKGLIPRRGQVGAAIRAVHEYATGAFFGVGLCVGGMVNPAKVAAFLEFTKRSFDPSLMVLMASALAVLIPGFYVIKNGVERPTFHPEKSAFAEPFKGITPKLLVGGALFGAGWGLAGVCPGPMYVNCGASLFGGTISESGCLDLILAFFVGQNVMREIDSSGVLNAKKTSSSAEKKTSS
jgi:uncharacterized membrane protein YedE/YeeE